jgi:alpha-beta hydrolase superfamily lysophospholipase
MRMIELQSPESTRPSGLLPDGPSGADRHTASRARLIAADGVPLHYRAWLPQDRRPTGSLLFVHGIASHGAWFAETAAYLADRGIAVYAPDRRGSGLSGGPRGHVAGYEQALDDLSRFLDLVAEEQPHTPLFLAGSSWAAKLAIAGAAQAQAQTPDRLAGLLLHGPALFPRVDLSFTQKLAVLFLHRGRGEHSLQIPLVPDDYTRNPLYLDYIRRDPYRLLTASARFFWETRRLDRARNRLAKRLSLPLLLQIGEADPIMDTVATCRWFQRLGAPDRTAIVYRNAAHTLDFEPEPTVRAYRADLLGWLRRQISRDSGARGEHGEYQEAGDVA